MTPAAESSAARLPILYRDDHLIAVHKPSGMLVHRSNLDRHATRFALQILRDQIGRHVFPVHRLDRGASGLLIFALDVDVLRVLGTAFEAGAVHKEYLALVRGHPPLAGVIDHPLARLADDCDGRVGAGLAQPARTAFERIATVELPHATDRYPTSRYALLRLNPVTGRRHQLRRHLKHIAHPIIGDATYGKGRHNRLFRDLFGVQRLLLACTGMQFAHPASGAPLVLSAAPAAEFSGLLRRLEWSAETCAPARRAGDCCLDSEDNP